MPETKGRAEGGARCDFGQVGEPAGVVLVDQAVESVVHGLFPHAAVQLVLRPLALQDPHLQSHIFMDMFQYLRRGLQWQGSDKHFCKKAVKRSGRWGIPKTLVLKRTLRRYS